MDRSSVETVLRHGWQVLVVGSGSCDPVEATIVVARLAHLVRGAPSVRGLADLPPDWEAHRPDVDAEWATQPIGSSS